MKPEGAAHGPLWTSLLEALAGFAPDPGSRILCLNFRPAWEAALVRQLQQQTLEMQALLASHAWPLSPQNGSQKADWLRNALQQPTAAASKDLVQFLNALEALRQLLSSQAKAWPTLWKLGSELQPDPQLLGQLQAGKAISPEAQRLLRQRQTRLKAQSELLDRLGLIVARARYGSRHGGGFARIGGSRRIALRQWVPERLDQLSIELEIEAPIQTVLLNGAHGSGKSRLLQSLYLASLMHQAGLPQRLGPDSVLPVFTGIWLLEAESLSERLDRLKPLLRSPQAMRLVLIDDFLAHSAPGEAYALGRAALERLGVKDSLTVAVSHHPLLARLGSPKGPLRSLALIREGTRSGKLELRWNESRGAGLIERARAAGWPNELLKQAEQIQAQLSQPIKADQAKKAAPAPKPKPAPKVPLKPLQADVAIGSTVFMPSLNLYGELRSQPDRRGRVQVESQGMTLEVPADQVVLSSRRKEKKGDTSGVRIQTWSVTAEACDLHGMSVDEALPLLDKFIDTAYYQGLPQLRIIHGKGTSALRRAVHAHLETLPYVKRYRLGHPGEGDSGVTIVELS